MSPADLKVVQGLSVVHSGDKLEPGRTYYAKIQLTGLESAFGTEKDVAEKLGAAGFGGVLVQKTPIDDVPDRAPFSAGTTYWGRGVWKGDARAAAWPSQVKAVWSSTGEPVDAAALAKLPHGAAQTAGKSPGAAAAWTTRDVALAFGLWYAWTNRRKISRFVRNILR
jgi:hypothetical protein